MHHFAYDTQMLEDERGIRWQVDSVSIENDYVALISLNEPRYVEVRAYSGLLAEMSSEKIRAVPAVDRFGIPVGPQRSDMRHTRRLLPKAKPLGFPIVAPVRLPKTSRVSWLQLLRTCLSLYLNAPTQQVSDSSGGTDNV